MNHWWQAAARSASVAALVLIGCSAESADWRSAQSADTVEAYELFIGKHPQSALAQEARKRVQQLQEESAWERATAADTVASYQEFLGKFPEGKWAEEARIRIENFTTLAAGGTPAPVTGANPAPAAKPATTVAARSGAAPATSADAGAAATAAGPTAASAAAVAPDGRFRIQLGAFSASAKAQSEWQRLSVKYAAELGALRPSIEAADTDGGKLYRLQAIVGDESRARSLCAALSAGGQGCLVIAPK
ncbi:MAG: SPOR domain-containing protein [Steroidobacteraceae bacterium]|nr:SPOR domain-containing protein [Steroidobacteraceae bacterium]MDW8258167.1 SPOR domain-containing protein [Gammaproteobacteria bacterium]